MIFPYDNVRMDLHGSLLKPCTCDVRLTGRAATHEANVRLDPGVKRKEMEVLNKAFSRAHAMSIHLNLVTIGATLWWGWQLVSKLQF